MKRLFSSAIILLSSLCFLSAFPAAAQNHTAQGQRQFKLIVREGNDTVAFNRGLNAMRGRRNLATDLLGLYRSTATGKLISASTNLLNFGISTIMEATRDKRPDWQKAVTKESTFVKQLPMQTEILDFYAKPSSIGALDPTNMYFNGFGCSQSIAFRDSLGNPHDEEVFYLSCSIRTDDHGLARMLNHSKFEIVVDELRFNPWLCNLPNDSIEYMPEKRIPFSFDSRKDLRFNVEAILTSSWINQAIQVWNDQEIGRFLISAEIDPAQLDEDGVFRYSASNPGDASKRIFVEGDSFLVPRSYIGSQDMHTAADSWGTGQYKVTMKISESCKINDQYYAKADGKGFKWDKEKWMPEWKIISSRKPQMNIWQTLGAVIGTEYAGNKWITTLIEPAATVLIQHEGKWLNSVIPTPGAAATPAAAQGQQTSPAAAQKH